MENISIDKSKSSKVKLVDSVGCFSIYETTETPGSVRNVTDTISKRQWNATSDREVKFLDYPDSLTFIATQPLPFEQERRSFVYSFSFDVRGQSCSRLS